MNTKIKELTENIYREGIEKAQAEGEQILQTARNEAEQIISDANEKAERLIAESRVEADLIFNSVKKELNQVAEQVIEVTGQKLVNMVSFELAAGFADELTRDPDFLKEMIFELTREWNSDHHQNKHPEILVSEKMIQKLEPLYKLSAGKVLSSGIIFKPVPELEQGFQIVNTTEGFKISFTSKDFHQFFFSLIKPRIRDLILNFNKK